MNEILNDDELRYALVQVFRMETARTAQTRIGASDLCDQCDRCLAMKLRGIKRTSPQAERPWFGREWGTAGHGLVEDRLNLITHWERDETLTPQERLDAAMHMRTAFGLPEGVRSERRVKIATIPGYGDVFGTIDIDLPGQIVDLKGTERKKYALLQDFLAMSSGSEGRRWEKQKDTKAYLGGYKLNLGGGKTAQLSYKAYHEALEAMAYKTEGYYGQLSLYGHARHLEGRPVSRLSIGWISRDGNGYFDDPGSDGYADPTRTRDINILSFDYNHDYAQSLIVRGAAIYASLEAGAAFADFKQHDACYACSFEREQIAMSQVEAMDVAPPVDLIAA